MNLVVKLILLAISIDICLSDVEVSQNGFRLFRQEQKTSQKNHIKLRFKTTDATGLIMFAQGANKKDFLSIELYRGKIRVAADFGHGTRNKLRPIGGFYDMYLGKDLADNEWHTVEFIRNIRESTIFIDRGRGKMEKSSFMKSPPTYNELSVSVVTFGGYFTYETSQLSTNKALSRKGIQGCFSEATFSQTWPEDNSREINFVDVSSGVETINEIVSFCKTPEYRPMFFPSSAVHIAVVENYTIDSMKLSMKFRTVVNEQTLANYTTITTSDKLQLKLDRKGRLQLGIEFDNDMQIIETAKEDYHDGLWHSTSFEIDNKPTTDNSYLAKFTVDGKTRLATISKNFYFNGYINIGFGFTGCMRDVKINDDDIHRVRRDLKDSNDFFTLSDVGVMYNSCSLKDYCNPNPCQNGGRCNQTEDNIMCDCRNTLYEGSTCHRARYNYTCAGVRKSGERRSDVYFIDFDGMGPMEPVRALCDLGKTVETTVTQINNTKHVDFDVSTPSGRNKVDINYAADIIQMRELISNSAFCQQGVKYTCKGTPMFRSPEGPPAVSWTGGDDILHYYWGGANGNRGYCQCGMDQNCWNTGKYCNCDDLNAFNNLFDEGNFSVKEHLPVRQLQFQQVLRGSVHSILRVDHLRCAGFGSRDVAATFRKPYSFLSVDHPDQPFDNIFAGGISFDFKTSKAYHYMTLIHAHGPFSGDYCKVMIWSRTMVRVRLNFGFGDIKQDVDLSSIGRVLDDNQWHEFDLMFNLKELNVTLDGIRMIQGLPLQEDPVQFNVDDKSVYVGGSYHDKNGFVGCMRSLYVNGRIHDIRGVAEGQEEYGVYPGCGSACVLLNKPCNYGECIDEYDDFKCNCSVSPFYGKFCQNETFAKKFTGGQSIVYDLKKANLSEPMATAILVIGFKTAEENTALARLDGNDDRHISLVLANGYLTLFYSMKKKIRSQSGILIDAETRMMRIIKRKLNNNEHNIARVHISTQEVFVTVPNYDYVVGENITERFIDEQNKNLGMKLDSFQSPTMLTIGSVRNEGIDTKGLQIGSSFSGCMTGAKFIYQPFANKRHRFRESVEIDMFKLIDAKPPATNPDPNPTGSFPTPTTDCGPSLPTPGTLPTVGPARQFFTRSPGLDDSVKVETVSLVDRILIMVIVFVVSVVLLGFCYLIYSRVNANRMEYSRLKKSTKPRKVPVSAPVTSAVAMEPVENPTGASADRDQGDQEQFFL